MHLRQSVQYDEHMDPTDDPFWRENVERARRMSPAQKLMDGADLFDYACSITLDGIRAQTPGISAEEALARLRERLRLAERYSRHGSVARKSLKEDARAGVGRRHRAWRAASASVTQAFEDPRK
jgi:hypothetical protein